MTLGKRMIRLREDKNIKQIDAARDLGISNVVLNRYEKNERVPDKDMLKTIADYYNCSVDYLLGRTNIRTPIETIAAHHDGDEFTEEELKDIEAFKEFVRMRREQREKKE